MSVIRNVWPLVPILLSFFTASGWHVAAQNRSDADPARTPPSPKEVVRLLLNLRDIPLRSHGSCATAGTSISDADLGDYVSGWLAELKQSRGANWLEASAKPEAVTPERQPGWRCTVMFRHVDGDDRWGWGVSFLVRASDRRLVQNSIRCLGAG